MDNCQCKCDCLHDVNRPDKFHYNIEPWGCFDCWKKWKYRGDKDHGPKE